ncbi:MAG TPA: phenylalanine--tRNA ligase subunit alpha [Candidatus Dormibacteraeota bacterium]
MSSPTQERGDPGAGLEGLVEDARAAFEAAPDLAALEAARALHLGRGDGLLTGRLRGIGAIADADRRRVVGQAITAAVAGATAVHRRCRERLEAAEQERRREAESLDLTRPAPVLRRGRLHPVTLATREIRRIFAQLGYMAVEGPELEYDRYNFELVNMPPGHPARDTQDTFFIDDDRLLRTHTSPVQIRAMVRYGAPLRVIVPGRTYRRDYDPTHFPMFHQVEGLCIDEDINLGDLKGTLLYFARSMFGRDRAIRVRPHHFPFTEPSIEVDISCMNCGGSGCRTCKHTGWLEILGSGMVHPQVLANGGIDPERYTGFAFGLGIERVAQLAYDVPDGRLFYENDVRFLRPR